MQQAQSAPDQLQPIWKLLLAAQMAMLCVQFGKAWVDLPAPVHQYIGSIVGGEKTSEGEDFTEHDVICQGIPQTPGHLAVATTNFLLQCSATCAL